MIMFRVDDQVTQYMFEYIGMANESISNKRNNNALLAIGYWKLMFILK